MANPIGLAAGFDKDGEAIDGTLVYSRVPVDLKNAYQGYLTLVSAGLKLGASLQSLKYVFNIKYISIQLILLGSPGIPVHVSSTYQKILQSSIDMASLHKDTLLSCPAFAQEFPRSYHAD